MANGSLTAHATLLQTMRRLVGVSELADEVMRRQETLVIVVIGGAQAQVQRHFVLQVLEAESRGLLDVIRRLLQPPPPGTEVPSGDAAGE
jgi:hypothetical protein